MTIGKDYKNILKRSIKLITFVDLPIRRKFTLFILGVLFWFVVMFVVSFATGLSINTRTDRIVNHLIPHDRITQKITKKLNALSMDITEMLNISDIRTFNKKINLSMERLSDIRDFASVMVNGGQVFDINRDNNQIIETLTVIPLEPETDRKVFSDALLPQLEKLNKNITELGKIKAGFLKSKLNDSGLSAKKALECKEIISEIILINDKSSAVISELYRTNSKRIYRTTRLNLFVFIAVFLIATILLILFTISISKSIADPVLSIIEQIRAMSEGRVDFSKKIKVRSKDEIGTLTHDFNYFMDELQEMTLFKMIIEEDDSLEDVYSRLGNVFSDKFGIEEFIIYEVNNSQNRMRPVYPVIMNDHEIPCNQEILNNCNLCKAKKTAHTVSSTEYTDICKQFLSDTSKVHVCIPMVIGGSIGGVVQFLFNRKYFSAEESDIRIFKYGQYIKESLSVIEAKRLMSTLRESAMKDSLTGLYNRRFLQEYTETLISGVLRRKKLVGLIMCDLDYFKQVNDIYGHDFGDKVLKDTSMIISKCVRNSDLVIRFGGEEFLVLVVDVEEGETFQIAEKIRESIANTKIKASDGTISKTISLGVSEFPSDTEGFWQAIKFADVALFKAKDSGRNKSVRFTREMWTEDEF